MPIDPAELAAGGPRAAGAQREYDEIVRTIAEGARLHYQDVALTADPDLDLLRGDERYAAGLSLLAARGDLEAVGELADVISLVALAQAAGDEALVDAVWEAGATAVGWGSSDALQAAKAAVQAGHRDATKELHDAAAQRR